MAFDALQAGMLVLGALAMLAVVLPFILPVFLPLLAAFLWLRRRYLATSRGVKRFDGVTRSPVFASLSAALRGLPTIRAYGAGARFRGAFLTALTRNGAWWFCFLSCARRVSTVTRCMHAPDACLVCAQ